jgi:anti-sigma B factor antagonist
MTARSMPIGAPAYAPMPFQIAVEAQRDTVTIAPRGELDLATIGQLQRELGRWIDAPPARIVIDLRGVEFLDSTGLHALLNAHAQAQQDNWELTLIPGPRAVQRIFEITCTIDRLPFAAANGRAATL